MLSFLGYLSFLPIDGDESCDGVLVIPTVLLFGGCLMKCLFSDRFAWAVAVAACALVIAMTESSRAALIFSEDFDDITIPDAGFVTLTTSTTGSSFTSSVSNSGGTNRIRVIKDVNNFFGAGTDNQVLWLADANTSNIPSISGPASLPAGTKGFQMSFDYYELAVPDSAERLSGGANGTQIRLASASGTGGNNSVGLRLSNTADPALGRFYALQEGSGLSGGIYSTVNYDRGVMENNAIVGSKFSVMVVGNYDSLDSITYAHGTKTIAPRSYHVWLKEGDGDYLHLWSGNDPDEEGNVPFRHAALSDPAATSFITLLGSSNASFSDTYFDNVQVWNEIVFNPIPEPSSALLLGMALAGLALSLCRKRVSN